LSASCLPRQKGYPLNPKPYTLNLGQVIQPTGIEIEPSKNKEIGIDEVLRAVLAWYKMVKEKVQGRKLEATSLK